MSLATYTTIHVIISLVGIAAGLIVLFGMFGGRKRLDGMTAVLSCDYRIDQRDRLWFFLLKKVTPAIILGIPVAAGCWRLPLLRVYPSHLDGKVARHLRDYRRGCPLFQLLCPGGAKLF